MSVTKTAPKVETPVAAPTHVDLEVVLYARYHRGTKLYEREKAYRFTPKQAAILLEEVDETTQQPIWRRYKVKAAAVRAEAGIKQVIDASKDDVVEHINPDADLARIDVGDESELAGILSPEEGIEV